LKNHRTSSKLTNKESLFGKAKNANRIFETASDQFFESLK